MNPFFLAERDESIIRRSFTVKVLNIFSVNDFNCGKFNFKMAISSSVKMLLVILGILNFDFFLGGGDSSSESDNSDSLPEEDSKILVLRSSSLSVLAGPGDIKAF